MFDQSPRIQDAMSERCQGGHRHVHLISGRPAAAAEYPAEFCRQILKAIGIWKVRQTVNTTEANELYNLMEFARQDLCCPEEAKIDEELEGKYIDDVKGGELNSKLAREARAQELKFFQERGVSWCRNWRREEQLDLGISA